MQRLHRRPLPAAGFATVAASAFGQGTYPSQPLKLIVPYPAGGATDTLGRALAQPSS